MLSRLEVNGPEGRQKRHSKMFPTSGQLWLISSTLTEDAKHNGAKPVPWMSQEVPDETFVGDVSYACSLW